MAIGHWPTNTMITKEMLEEGFRKAIPTEHTNSVTNNWDEDLEYELPPYHYYMRHIYESDPEQNLIHELRCLLGLEQIRFFQYSSAEYLKDEWLKKHVHVMLEKGYDYQNLYSPDCDTAIYYFIEAIVLDFDDMQDDDDCYPYGWFDFFGYCDRVGIKLPSFSDGGKYGKSMTWE